MESRDIVRIARQRAGLSQEQLGLRSGIHRGVIGRWERGDSEPSLRALRKLVAACELELVLRLATSDPSLDEAVDEQLARIPTERLELLLPPDLVGEALESLRWLAGVETPAILIGNVAAVLQGAPQRTDTAVVEIVSRDSVATENELRAAGFEPTDTEARWRDADRRSQWTRSTEATVELASAVPGTTDYRDLGESAETFALDDGTEIVVAHPRDLLRIAEASPSESARARVPGLEAVLARRRSDSK
jgi:transcriptional regulator with XRE-family HTH domain